MIRIKKFIFNTFQVNSYVLYDETGECILVDPGCIEDAEKLQLEDFIRQHGLTPVRNILTHCHVDHILGNTFISEKYHLNPEYHPAGAPFFRTVREIALSFGYELNHLPPAGPPLHDGDVITFGKSGLTVIYTPGHAAGSICLHSPEQKFILTGDVLFRDTIGRTDLPTGDLNLLLDSIREKLFTLPDETEVYCGHGPETTIGYEKMNNPFIR